MPDITMCPGSNRFGIKCPMKKACRRYTARPDKHSQSFFSVAPFYGHVEGEKVLFSCDEYQNNGKELPRG